MTSMTMYKKKTLSIVSNLLVVIVLLVTQKSFAQHFLQIDDGLGHYSLITGSNTGGTYILPPGGGTLLTSASTWLTAGNTLSGGSSATPTQFMGSTNNFDVIFRSNNIAHMTLGTNGYLSLVSGAQPAFSPSDPFQVYNLDNTANPPFAAAAIQSVLTPSGPVASSKNALYVSTTLYSSAANLNGAQEGIVEESFLNSDYTGLLAYGAQCGNFSLIDASPTTVPNADAIAGSIYATGTTNANIISNARGVIGQIFNQGPGNITNSFSFWARSGNIGAGTVTNSYLFYGVNPASGGITNLTGLYLEQLTGAANINAIKYAHPVLPFVVSGNGNVGIGTAIPGVGAKLSFGATSGSPADIFYWDGGVATSRYGIGIQSSELQTFVPTGSHFSWNGGGDLQASGTNEVMRLTGTGKLSVSSLINITTATTPLTGYQIQGLTVLHNTGSQNIFVGVGSGAVIGTGSSNIAIGYQSLFSNTTGSLNTASGAQALQSNTTGNGNTASGAFALSFNTTGNSNTAFGTQALQSNTTGNSNTASGAGALLFNTTGFNNTAVGSISLFSNTTGSSNTASGSGALSNNTTGFQNTASGSGSLVNNTLGSNNTASGAFALNSTTTANDNTAFGTQALQSNTTGTQNTAVGSASGLSNTTENKNTFIGFSSNGAAGITNATAIGANAIVTQSNSLILGSGAKVGVGLTAPHSLMHVQDGDVEVDDNVNPAGTHGIVLKSPNGNCWRVTVSNFGALVVTAIACP